jgi:hypothetical protein
VRAVRPVRGTVCIIIIVISIRCHSSACVLTEGKEPPAATDLIVSRSHCEVGERGGRSANDTKAKKNSHVFGARNTTGVINPHFPLV